MINAVTTLAVLSSATASAQSYHNYYGHVQPVSFPEQAPLIDPELYKHSFDNFAACKKNECTLQAGAYTDDISHNIATLGLYTSCVTGCVAQEIFHSVTSYKVLLGEVFEIGTARLRLAREYLAGESDYDVLKEATHVEDSCCLPDDYFTTWDSIFISVNMVAPSSRDITVFDDISTSSNYTSINRMVSVSMYLDMCTDDSATDYSGEWKENLKIVCDTKWVEYFELIQHNIGSLIMAPHATKFAPSGSCSKKDGTIPNPIAGVIGANICKATYFITDDNAKIPITAPFLKKAIPSFHMYESCPSDFVVPYDSALGLVGAMEVKYQRVHTGESQFYTLSGGLPSEETFSPDECKFDLNLNGERAVTEGSTDVDAGSIFEVVDSPVDDAIAAAKVCPYNGLFEYCNMQQYATYLQKQLFDSDACQITDMREEYSEVPANLHTLACLYKTVSMKCDCMEAVLNCYEHQKEFNDPMAGTIGKAASILCGFILCLKPKIYSLFGGGHAIDKANIMRELLSQVGLSVPSSSLPPATFAFLAFGIGMVAFVATKIVSKKNRKAALEEGYAQLI